MGCNPIIIGTSLAPFNIEKQMRAVKSWIENGFYVISCNTMEEIEILKESFSELPIEFAEIERTAEKVAKKKLPYLQDILNVVSDRTDMVCGFINSDIILSKMPKGMYEFIANETRNSLVFMRRNEINEYSDIQELNWNIHFDGIDGFFIDKKIANGFFDDGFYVQSLWDRCILLKCKILNIKIKELVNPIAFHIKHTIAWDFEKSISVVDQFVKKYFGTIVHTYKYVKDWWYRILYEECKQVCFCSGLDYKCLFVLDGADDETIKSINEQEYENKNIFLGKSLDNAEENFDIVFEINKGMVLSRVFCKTIIYMMEQFGYDALIIGRFFVSEFDQGKYYNELNRNMIILKKINADCDIYSCAYRINRNKNVRMIYLPISYEMIDIMNNKIVDKITVDKKLYVIPAGAKAGAWFSDWRAVNNNVSNVLGFIDNDSKKIGNVIMEKKVYSVRVLEENPEAIIVIASKYYNEEIQQQLADSLLTNKILNASYMLAMDNSTIYYFNIEKYKKMSAERKTGKN